MSEAETERLRAALQETLSLAISTTDAVFAAIAELPPSTPNPEAVRRISAHLWGEDINNIRAAVESFANGWTVVKKPRHKKPAVPSRPDPAYDSDDPASIR